MTKMFKTIAAADKAMSIQPATTPAFDAIFLERYKTCRSNDINFITCTISKTELYQC